MRAVPDTKLFRLAKGIFMISGTLEVEEVTALAEALVREASERQITISTAESCTGGMIAAFITTVAGSSEVFLGGVVSYSNDLKMKVLGVSGDTLKTHGAVSEETALEMVRGVRELTGATLSVSVTGIAGPGGGSKEKPVGLVFIALKGPEGFEQVVRRWFSGDRMQVRVETTKEAIRLLKSRITQMATDNVDP